MTTAIISDLHLGARFGTDVLRHHGPRRALLDDLEDVERLVLLGDALELRHGPLSEALESATAFFDELGRAFAGREVVFVPGNHDHQLAGEILRPLELPGVAEPLGLERTASPEPSSALGWIAERMGGTKVSLAYPGLWVRPDVYATHGHYLDAHLTVPRVECLAIGVVEKLVGRLPEGALTPADYEAVLAPVYALAHQLAQATSSKRGVAVSDVSARVWTRISPASGRRDLGARLLGDVAIPTAVAALNRAGLGPFSARVSGSELRRAGLEAMAAVVSRLGIEAEHVIFGHTHRGGPEGGETGFELPGGRGLVNCGSWLEDVALGGAGSSDRSPYRPGVVVRVGASGPPELRRVLDGMELG